MSDPDSELELLSHSQPRAVLGKVAPLVRLAGIGTCVLFRHDKLVPH